MRACKTIHAGAVAVGDIGILIFGESGAGKSALAARMIADWPFGRVRLVADDRVRLCRVGDRLVARPHPAIRGAIEVRGFGIVEADSLDAVIVRGVIRLVEAMPDRLPSPKDRQEMLLGAALPRIDLPIDKNEFQRLLAIWPHFHSEVQRQGSIIAPAP